MYKEKVEHLEHKLESINYLVRVPLWRFDRFIRLLNIKGEDRKLLVKCYIVASFIPEFDKPILMLHGDPGAAKSTLQELIKTLVDPSSVLTFALPRDVNELDEYHKCGMNVMLHHHTN